MAKIKNIRTLDDIRKERQYLQERRKEMESSFFSFSKMDELPGSSLWLDYAKNFVFNRLFNKKNKSKQNSSTSKSSKRNVFSFLSQLISHPTANSLLGMTKRSFIKWQLFNASVYLLQIGYKAWQKKRKEKKIKDAIIREE